MDPASRHPSPAGARLRLGNGFIIKFRNKHLGPFISTGKWRVELPKDLLTGSSQMLCGHGISPPEANTSSSHVAFHCCCWMLCARIPGFCTGKFQCREAGLFLPEMTKSGHMTKRENICSCNWFLNTGQRPWGRLAPPRPVV